MGQSPAYYRARLDSFRYFIQNELPGHPAYDSGEKSSPLELLKYGFVHPDIKERFESRVESFARLKIPLPDNPLSFTEHCSFNTWFAMHPEKVAGTEVITSSRDFPLTIKGTKEDVIKTLSAKNNNRTVSETPKRLRIIKAKAIAKQRILDLLNI